MLSWLRQGPILEDGSVLSWVNPARPGYPYPEAAGLVLGLLSERGTPGELESRVARALTRVVSPDGAVGRRGLAYPFDTAVALRGLLAYERAGGSLSDPSVLDRMFGFIERCIATRVAVLPTQPGDRWSTGYNPHLLKLVIVSSEWQKRTSDPRAGLLSARLSETLEEGALCIFESPDGSPRYSHAACYAAEALVHLARGGSGKARAGAERAAAFFAALQGKDDGALPAWSRDGDERRRATDATAQAIGIWTFVDAAHFSENVARALEYLASVQHPSGGLRYAAGSDDVNTWCTVFGLDALKAVD